MKGKYDCTLRKWQFSTTPGVLNVLALAPRATTKQSYASINSPFPSKFVPMFDLQWIFLLVGSILKHSASKNFIWPPFWQKQRMNKSRWLSKQTNSQSNSPNKNLFTFLTMLRIGSTMLRASTVPHVTLGSKGVNAK